jgi:POT family proton-dependent oligopeptide transporter
MERSGDTAFFGHPKGLAYLAFTEVWEGFSYYGMQALLMLYMVGQLLRPGHFENVGGLDHLRGGLESIGGPMTTIALASQIFGLYVGLVNTTPLLGGWLGDRVLGQTRTIVLGAVLMTLGHLCMTSERLFLLALLLLVLGAGFIKGNMAVQIGRLYGADDPRRTRGFGIYMLVRNIGALSAPLVCGTLGETLGWHYGFGVAAIAMVAALIIYLAGRRHLPPEPPVVRLSVAQAPLTRDDWRAILGLLLAFVPFVLMFSAVYQAYTLFPVWATDHVDRQAWGLTIPVTWIFTFDGIATMAGILVGVRLWRALDARGREPDDIGKIAIGCTMASTAFAILALGAATATGPVPLAWVLAFFLLLDFSFIWGEPPLKAFVSRHAPPAKATIMMSLAIMSIALANFTVGWLGRFYERMGAPEFWLLHAGIALTGLTAALLLRPIIHELVDRRVPG